MLSVDYVDGDKIVSYFYLRNSIKNRPKLKCTKFKSDSFEFDIFIVR